MRIRTYVKVKFVAIKFAMIVVLGILPMILLEKVLQGLLAHSGV